MCLMQNDWEWQNFWMHYTTRNEKYFKESKCIRLLQTYILLPMLNNYFSWSKYITVEEI